MRRCTLEEAVELVLERIDGPIRMGMPLGLGKPNRFVNALYRRICASPERELTIYTALSLARPQPGSELEQRFAGPFLKRVYADHVELDYLTDLRCGELPANVRIEEFYLQPASQLQNELAQQRYVSLNYSQVARDLQRKGINLIVQLVALDEARGRISLSCNPDITLDLLPGLHERRAAGETILCIAQPHADLPFMGGDAELAPSTFDLLLEPVERHRLFSTPNLPVSLQDHAIGLHASALVRDGGSLQLGIGSMADAVTAALLARQRDNADYQAALARLQVVGRWGELIAREGGLEPFTQGLYACSEMFVHGLLSLLEAGVIARAVYPEESLQRLADAGGLDATGRLADPAALRRAGLPGLQQAQGLEWLQRHGLLDPRLAWQDARLQLPDGRRLSAEEDETALFAALRPWLRPAAGAVLVHGGFFLGPQDFYRRLREMDETSRQRIGMTAISFINRLYGDEPLKRLQRRHARFINSCFVVTLLGASAANQLDDGRVLSGVGGQYDFVAQAHELEGARSILMLRSWRESGGELSSNIRWDYGHATIPRHLRDLVVTEYGIADLRGKSDAQVIEALLKVADSRFQDELIEAAQKAGKLERDFVLDAAYRQNTPERLEALCAEFPQLFADFPLGSDFTEQEQELLRALGWLKSKLRLSEILELGAAALFEQPDPARYRAHLQRMGLEQPEGLREQLYRKLLLAGLGATARPQAAVG